MMNQDYKTPPGAHPITPPPELSPAAQAVLDVSMTHSGPAFEPLVRRMTADALRAAADQMSLDWTPGHCMAHLRAIAAELGGNND